MILYCAHCKKEIPRYSEFGDPLTEQQYLRKKFCSRKCNTRNYDITRKKRDRGPIIWGEETKNIDIYLRIPLC